MKREFMKRLSSHCCVEKNEKIYFPALNFNALYCMELDGSYLQFLGSIPEENLYGINLYGAIYEKNNILYLAPMNGERIATYNIVTKEMKTISIDTKKYGIKDMKSKFFRILSKDEYIYFIPCRYRAIIKLNIVTGEITYIDGWYKAFFSDVPVGEMFVKRGAFIYKDKLLLATCFNNFVIEIDLNSYKPRCITVGNAKSGYMDAFFDGKYMWLLEKFDTKLWRYDFSTEQSRYYNHMPSDLEVKGWPFICILDCNDKILAVSYHTNKSVIFNKTSGLSECIDLEASGDIGLWNAKHYFAQKISKNEVLMSNIPDHTFALLDMNTMKTRKFVLRDEKYEKRLFESYFLVQDKIVKEMDETNLEQFINYVKDNNLNEKYKDVTRFGSLIHWQISNELES